LTYNFKKKLMKKLFLLLLISSSSYVGAQMLQTDDFNGLILGDVGTDITGLTTGQGDYYTATSNGVAPTTGTNAGTTNFQVVANGFTTTNGLKITSSNGNKGNRFLWKDGLLDAWNSRDLGNDIIEVEYDFYTGPATASTAQAGVRLYGTDDTVTPAVDRVLNGYVYNANTRVLQGVAYLNNAGTYGTYLITLGATALTLTANTWYRAGFAYDSTTGETIWKVDTVYTGLPAANWAGPFVPNEVDFVSAVPTTNTAASDFIVDNYTVKATATEGLLSVNHVAEKVNFTVSPNPASTMVSINSSISTSISNVQMFDLNGRMVKSVNVDNLSNTNVSISDLAAGVYMMKITSENGIVSKEVIKE
jgi:hypothetical protein